MTFCPTLSPGRTGRSLRRSRGKTPSTFGPRMSGLRRPSRRTSVRRLPRASTLGHRMSGLRRPFRRTSSVRRLPRGVTWSLLHRSRSVIDASVSSSAASRSLRRKRAATTTHHQNNGAFLHLGARGKELPAPSEVSLPVRTGRHTHSGRRVLLPPLFRSPPHLTVFLLAFCSCANSFASVSGLALPAFLPCTHTSRKLG